MENGKRTFVMIKPDGVERGLVGEIVSRFERRGFKLAEARMMRISRETAEEHYAQHKGKPFFGELVDYITSGPVFAMILEGEGAVALARAMIGATNPRMPRPARSAATTRGRSKRTSSTVPIPTRAQSARSGGSSVRRREVAGTEGVKARGLRSGRYGYTWAKMPNAISRRVMPVNRSTSFRIAICAIAILSC